MADISRGIEDRAQEIAPIAQAAYGDGMCDFVPSQITVNHADA